MPSSCESAEAYDPRERAVPLDGATLPDLRTLSRVIRAQCRFNGGAQRRQ